MRRAAAGIIDGKAVCCGDDGVPSFDLIELNGDDLRARAARGAEEHARLRGILMRLKAPRLRQAW
jgi:hypothetical protein